MLNLMLSFALTNPSSNVNLNAVKPPEKNVEQLYLKRLKGPCYETEHLFNNCFADLYA